MIHRTRGTNAVGGGMIIGGRGSGARRRRAARDRKRPQAVSAGRYLGRLPEGFEASMSTVSPPKRPCDPPMVARPGSTRSLKTHAAVPTPLFTRHMLGATEAERDRRGLVRTTHPRRLPGRTAMAHPRLDAALEAQARRRAQARVDLSRWADEGGRFDPEAATRLRIGDRQMKRCKS
jgi:hypothetical protein